MTGNPSSNYLTHDPKRPQMFLHRLRRAIFGSPKTPHTWASEFIAVVIAVLGSMQIYWAIPRLSTPDQSLIALVMGLCSILFGIFTARYNTFEARLIAGVIAGAEFVILTLAFTWGLPGQKPYPLEKLAVVAYVGSAILLVLLVFDARIRTAQPPQDPRPPYAL